MDYGEKHLFDEVKIDYFAVSMPDLLIWEEDLKMRNKIHCLYLIGLGHFGLTRSEAAKEELNKLIMLDNNHLSAWTALKLIENLKI